MPDARRPIAARSSGLAIAAARRLARAGVAPDMVSAASLAFAALAATALLLAPSQGRWLMLVAAALVPLRLIANLLDGMVAVEHGRGGPLGPLWNEVPDRLSDVAILAAAGTAAAALGDGLTARIGAEVGWAAAAVSLFTAYVRELGRAVGAPADYGGPLAKQQRMWVVVVGALLTAAEPLWDGKGEILFAAVTLVAAGALLTAALRLARLAGWLRAAQRTKDSDGEGRASSPRVT